MAPRHVTATAVCSLDTDGRDRRVARSTAQHPGPDVWAPPRFPTLPPHHLGPRTRVQWHPAVITREPRAASPSRQSRQSSRGPRRHVNQGGQQRRHVSNSQWHVRRGEAEDLGVGVFAAFFFLLVFFALLAARKNKFGPSCHCQVGDNLRRLYRQMG